jgi:uncharacterized membrane protein required for colicin V production
MSITDVFILLLILSGIVYGFVRGIRPSLFLLTTFLSSLLAVVLLTIPLEHLILNLSGIGADLYPDAPAVAVLILEGQDSAAYLASFIPGMLVFFFILALIVGGLLLKPFFREVTTGPASRLFGMFFGLFSGITAALLVILQLLRLPWPLAGTMFRESLILTAFNHFALSWITSITGIL